MADPTELQQFNQVLNLLLSALQPLDQMGQKAFRAITQDALRPPVNESYVVEDLSNEPLVFTTDVDGAWDAHVMGIRFDNADPRKVRICLVLGDYEYPLVDEDDYEGESVVVTDNIKLNTGDQIRCYANGGTGRARAEIRGELR